MADDEVIIPPRTGIGKWKGTEFRVQEVQLNEDGSSLVLALGMHPRVALGQQCLVKASEVVWDA